MNIVCDIDGTIADIEHRLHYIQKKPKDYDRFFKECYLDKPIHKVIAVLKDLVKNGNYHLIFCTGRKEKIRKETELWLYTWADFINTQYILMMRPNDDNRPDSELKPEMLHNAGISPYNTLCVFEDRAKVVKALREVGFTVLQVTEGEY